MTTPETSEDATNDRYNTFAIQKWSNPSIVIAIEQARYSPSIEMAFKIARVFNVGLDDVFQYPDDDQR